MRRGAGRARGLFPAFPPITGIAFSPLPFPVKAMALGFQLKDLGGEPRIVRLREVLEGQQQVLAIHCGHLHRQIVTRFAGNPLAVTPSVAPLAAMDLNPIEAGTRDERELITTEPPTLALHR